MNKSILVTGGAGFIASHIVEYLLENDAKFIRILDDLSTGCFTAGTILNDTFKKSQ